jgi:tRNA(Arg) A34 adenosine deaminase TadA
LAIGYNKTKEHTLQQEYNKYRNFEIPVENAKNSIHAEIDCLSKVKYLDIDWSRVTAVIFRQYNDGSYALARPCPACMAALKDRGIKIIYYTIEDGYRSEVLN